jgi:tripartite-type tricarboxylate transporter receptor subunit TctC
MNLSKIAALASMTAAFMSPALAAWPEKSVKVIVPFAAGGPVDAVARELTVALTQQLGQTFYVENQGGATGKIAVSAVVRAPADGYTLLFGSSGPVVLQPLIEKKPRPDLAAVGMVSVNPMVLVVSNTVPAKDVAELVSYAKAHPGKLNFGSGGVGGIAHLGTEMFKTIAGVDVVHVPYKGTGPIVVDMISGNLQATFTSYPSVKSMVEKSQLRAIGLTSKSKSLTTLPLIKSTVPGFEFSNWYGMLAPAGTPAAVVTKLNAAMRGILSTPAFQKKMEEQGAEIDDGTPQEMVTYMDQEAERWKKALANVKINLN